MDVSYSLFSFFCYLLFIAFSRLAEFFLVARKILYLFYSWFSEFHDKRWDEMTRALRIAPSEKFKYNYNKSQNLQIILSWFVLELRWCVPSLSRFLHKPLVDFNLSQQACRRVMVCRNDNNCNITFDNVFLITIMLVITVLYLK